MEINQLLFACYIPPTADLRPGVKIAHGVGIVIHQNSVIGSGTIYQNVTVGSGKTVGKTACWALDAVFLGDIHIGNNVSGCYAVVIHDVPDNCTVVGVPARIVKRAE